MPRYGKIHSMPAALQDAASRMIESGKTQQQVADGLNAILKKAEIKGLEPDVTQKNVQAWSESGHKRWLENQRAKELADRMAKIKENADPTAPDPADQLAAALVAEITIELAVIKEQYEPGEERAERIIQIVGGLVALRRTNQAKGWLKIEVAKTRMNMSRFEQETGRKQDRIPGKREGGITQEKMDEIDHLLQITKCDEDGDFTFEHFSKQDVEKIREEAKPMLDNL